MKHLLPVVIALTLFASLSASAQEGIKYTEAADLTLVGSCSYEFTHSNAKDENFGAVVGYHKGNLENVKVASDITLADVADIVYNTNLGGLVGRSTEGSVTDCA